MKATTKLYRVSATLVAMAALTATAALGQVAHPQPTENVTVRPIGEYGLPVLDVMPDPAQAHIARGDELLGQEQYRKARREYEAAAKIIREAEGFPAVPLNRLANSYYFEGLSQNAVSTLDRLAKEAAEVGDVARQAWAQADAAWVLIQRCNRVGSTECPGGRLELKQRLAKLRRLLASPYLPDEVRTEIIEKRCGGSCSVQKLAGN